MSIKGIIFDMDGVVTQTATLHFKAWRITIMRFLKKLDEPNINFTEQDYFHYLDGMPREEGLKHYLTSQPQLLSKIETIYHGLEACIEEISSEKNDLFRDLITTDSVQPFPDTLEFIDFLLTNNYQIALITSSKNCTSILQSAQIEHLFPIIVDGLIAKSLNIPGKPEPGIFLEAAKRMQLLPQECVIVEDALAGVAAAKAGRFGGVIALDRHQKLMNDFSDLNPDYILPDLSQKQLFLYSFLKTQLQIQSGFKALSLIDELLKNRHELILFSDFDGTLTPIVSTPKQASLSSSMYGCLEQLCLTIPTVLISGRALQDLEQKVNLRNISYAGNHGLEFKSRIPELKSFCYGEEFQEDIKQAFQYLHERLKDIPGCIIENKHLTISIHYRQVESSKHKAVIAAVKEAINRYPQLLDFHGKKVFELRPKIEWNKGHAAHFIFNHLRREHPYLIPIYLGDDISDEDAFNAFYCNGITIKVSSETTSTQAHYVLDSPAEVELFLKQIIRYQGEQNE